MYATPEQARILREAVAEIKAHPETFDMDIWECGTTCCLAGQIVRNAVHGEEWHALVEQEQQARRTATAVYPIRERARAELDLMTWKWTQLFCVADWPHDIRHALRIDEESGRMRKPTPNELEARVERWIASGE